MTKLNPSVLEKTANQLAATVPDWAGRKFTPLLSWWQDGEDILLLGSDGRKIRFVPDQVKQILGAEVAKKASSVMSLPTHTTHTATTPPDPVETQHVASHTTSNPPAKSKAGK